MDFRRIHLATVGEGAWGHMAKNKFEVRGLVACEGGWECLALVCRVVKNLECLGDGYPNAGDWLGRPQSHRMNPQLPFLLKISTTDGGRGVYKSRLKGVTGKYLKIFLYENSHGLTDGDECKIGKNLERKCETSKNFILGIFWLQLCGTLLPSPLDKILVL